MRPLTLAALKAELKIKTAQDDALLASLLARAIGFVERLTGRVLRPVDIVIERETFADLLLPVLPIRSVSSVKYLRESDGEEVVLPSTNWYTTSVLAPFVSVRFVGSLPTDVLPGSVRFYVSAGLDAIPDSLCPAIVGIVGHWYNNPEATSPITLQDVPLSFKAIIAAHAVHGGAI